MNDDQVGNKNNAKAEGKSGDSEAASSVGLERYRQWAQEHGRNSLAWFEDFYRSAEGDESQIPWADGVPNPNLMDWLERETIPTGSALVVGSGLGDDAEALAARGFQVTAFDISERAIAWSKERWPNSQVRYIVADLFTGIPKLEEGFEFVFESYTLQAIPPHTVKEALEQIAGSVKLGGSLLVVTRGTDEGLLDLDAGPPWPLSKKQLMSISELGFKMARFEDYQDGEENPKRRFRAHFIRELLL